MRIYGHGIRRRAASMLGGDGPRLRMAWSLLFSLPGTPVMLYGDEIGMVEDLELEGRMSVRTPMQWDHRRRAGARARFAVALRAALAHQRREAPELGWGVSTLSRTSRRRCSPAARTGRGRRCSSCTTCRAEPVTAELDLGADVHGVDDLLGCASTTSTAAGCSVELGAYGYLWLRARRAS